ncbi:hypothetical protein LOK49_LG02G03331 [Camellia lanceoleosa]|uniref:Uncharacterized protein n=1 Tax=Camellia lanceoleosa TaxID=1840588 RepID=A0ACC0IJE1_9ERIC|nr:hypothetical protein LOK49_LG02G03331 [Camellia lanceoleosa]
MQVFSLMYACMLAIIALSQRKWNCKRWFIPSDIGYGYRDFLSLSDLNDTSKGFLVNDAVIVEAEIKL